jgi:hypothetical protein
MTLHIPINDVKHRAYCGPIAASALTGVPVSRIEMMIRRRRRGYRDSKGRRRPIKGTYSGEILCALQVLGCKWEPFKTREPTFGRFCEDTAHINATFLVEVTGHFMAVYRGTFCDTSHLQPTPVEGYPKAKRRVRRVWRIEAPAEPQAGAYVPPVRETKPKPDLRTVRAARVAARIKSWTTKRKRAETALRKLRRQARYYGLDS